MWFVPACVVVAVGCDWLPKCVGMAIGCDWRPRTHVSRASWMWLVPACVAVAVDVFGSVYLAWQLDVIGTHEFVVPVGCGWCPRVWLWQLDVFDPEVCGMTIG